MVNYGYGKGISKNWKEDRKLILADRLREYLNNSGFKVKNKDIDYPYIEVDNLYDGVRIRKITYLSDEEHTQLVKDADKIYNEVMD